MKKLTLLQLMITNYVAVSQDDLLDNFPDFTKSKIIKKPFSNLVSDTNTSVLHIDYDKKATINPWINSQKLFHYSHNYTLENSFTNNSKYIRAIFKADFFTKKIFTDHYQGYRDELKKYLPPIPGVRLLCPIN